MKWLSMLFGNSKTSENLLDKDNGLLAQVGGWIGGMSFTEQEQAEFQARAADGVMEYVKLTLTENTTRSKTRREVAVMWIATQLLLVLASVIAWPFSTDYAKFIWLVASSVIMTTGTLSVIAFFFGPYMIGSHLRKKAPPHADKS